jgi:3-oxoacyl-[acyl-carrier protein] reductase
MNLGIAGKTAIVTGASAGIGRAIAREFAETGVNLVLVARGAERLSETAKDIADRFGVEVLWVAADVGDSGEPDRVVASAVERFGSVDIMVNNAGRACAGGIMAASEADWEEMTVTKLSAMRRFCRCRHSPHAPASLGAHRQYLVHRWNSSELPTHGLACAQCSHQQSDAQYRT